MEDTALVAPSFSLPCELYREIARHLQEPRDRPHLIALALVNAAWCKESQRILFGRMCDGSDKLNYWSRFGCIATHMRFLETILAYPQRLGPLVRSYAQVYLVDIDHTTLDPSYELWELTLQALPLLTNLKELAIVPEIFNGTLWAADVLSRCTCQLTRFSWSSRIICNDGDMEQFLIQHGSHLQHFDAGDVDQDLHTITADSCPELKSVFCNPASLPRLMNDRRITALRILDNGHPVPTYIDINPSAADAVRYLSMDLLSLPNTFANVVLLELLVWTIETTQKLSRLPSLKTLVLHDECDGPNPDFGNDEAILEQLLDEACGRCASLAAIIQERTRHWESGVHEFERFSISRKQPQVSVRPSDVYRECVIVCRPYFTPWWEIYETTYY